MSKNLEKIVKTELGEMSIKSYLDICIKSKALFWKAEREGIKKIKYFAGLGSKSMEINKSMFDYAMSKVNYQMNFCTGIGE